MSTAKTFLAGALALTFFSSPVDAQTARRAVRAGNVTGLELGLEGAMSGIRGRELVWLITAYEVVGLDQLRPSPNTRVRVATSLDDASVIRLTTDERGRTVVRLPIPADAPASFGVSLRLRSPRGVQRRFRLPVQTAAPERLQLTLPVTPQVGGDLPVMISVRDFDASAEESLELTLSSGAQILAGPVRITPGPGGTAVHVFEDIEETSLQVRANLERPSRGDIGALRWSQTRSVSASARRSAEGLVVQVAPAQPQAGPATNVPIAVLVRTPRGRPVAGARVAFDQNLLRPTVDPQRLAREVSRRHVARTDAQGRATLETRTPNVGDNRFRDHSVSIAAAHPLLGGGRASARVRVHRRPYYARLVSENGALVPEMTSRVAVQVVNALGHPAPAGVSVELSGDRIPDARATTDEDGYALLDIALQEGSSAACGGESGAQIQIAVQGGFSDTRCLPVDVDALVRPYVEELRISGGPVRIRVDRRSAARRMPVLLSFFARPDGAEPSRSHALDHIMVSSRNGRAEWTPPAGFAGPVLVRARALEGREGRELRGAFTMITLGESRTPRRLDGDARGSRDELVLAAQSDAPQTIALAVPRSMAPAAPSVLEADSTAAAIFRFAQYVPRDTTAPSVWRGEVVPAPAPENPEASGLLRDPWRTRDRFVEGRLGLVFQALERAVEANIPGNDIGQVAIRRGDRLVFHRQVLATLQDDALGAEGATGLGGDPLDLRTLQQLDRDVSFDSVARRMTRRRLLRLLVGLRGFVTENGLDLEWTRRGDPSLWLDSLAGRWVGDAGLERRDLADAWGRAFVLRRVSRPRFDRVQPVVGYELVSAGPDGRVGNGDDIVDPTAPVIRPEGLYGRAVGESALVARLRGVELGRATLDAVAGALGGGRPGVPYRAEDTVATPMFQLPSAVVPPVAPLAFEATRHSGDVHLLALSGGAATVNIADLPQRWSVLFYGFGGGRPRIVRRDTFAGAPFLVETSLPRRMRTEEDLSLDVTVTNAAEAPARIELRASAAGDALEASAPGDAQPIGGGHVVKLPLRLLAREAGDATVELELADAQGQTQRRIERPLRVDEGGHPLRQVRSALSPREGSDDLELEIEVPDDARRVHARAIVLSPTGLGGDPELAELRDDEPALIAWSAVLAGRTIDDESIREISRVSATGGDGLWGPIRHAATLVVTASLSGRGGRRSALADAIDTARRRADARLWAVSALPDTDPVAGGLRADAARLVLLAGGNDDERALSSRARLRTAIRRVPARPGLLARAAAALLLADPEDTHGRAMLTQAAEAFARSGQVASAEGSDGPEQLRATLALALAAHARGDQSLRERLLDAAGPRMVWLRSNDPEAVVYWFALGAYGALGEGGLEEIEVQGDDIELALASGMHEVSAAVDPGDTLEAEIPSAGARHLVRTEAVYARPFAERRDAPLELVINGPVGEVGSSSGMRLEIVASETLERAVVEVQLPTGVQLDPSWRAGLGAVRNVSMREPGFLRFEFGPIAEGVRMAVPLNFRWRLPIMTRGLAVIAYDASHPERMTILPARDLQPSQPRWTTPSD